VEFHLYSNTLAHMFQFIQFHCEIYGDPCMEWLQPLTCSLLNVGLPVNVIPLQQFLSPKVHFSEVRKIGH